MTALADVILARLDEIYPPAADPVRAAGAAAYMRNQFPFVGLTTPQLTKLNRAVLAGLAAPTEADLVAVARACWARPEPVANHGSSMNSGRPTRRMTRSAMACAEVEMATQRPSFVR